MSEPRLCATCVTPDTYPGIDFDANGVCSHCRDHGATEEEWQRTKEQRRARLDRFIARAKAKQRPYDALVPLSGGKDSTYTLFLATKQFHLRVLAFTFDNGFQSEVARSNIAGAIERCGADHILLKPDQGLMMSLYRHFFRHTGLFCPVCMRGICAGTFAMTRLFRIPLVLTGTSQRTEERLTPEIFQDGRYSFFRSVLRSHPFEQRVGLLGLDRTPLEKLMRGLFLLSGRRIALGPVEIPLPDYLDWDYTAVYETISREMGWRALPERDEHVDCIADPIAHYLRQVRVPDLTPNTLRYSAEIRAGLRARTAAASQIEAERENWSADADLQEFAGRLGITATEFRRGLENPLRHMQHQKDALPLRILNLILNGR